MSNRFSQSRCVPPPIANPSQPVYDQPGAVQSAPLSLPSTQQLSGASLLAQLRRESLLRNIGTGSISSVLRRLHSEVTEAPSSAPNDLPLTVHRSGEAIRSALQGTQATPHRTNNLLRDFNRVVTFRVPAGTTLHFTSSSFEPGGLRAFSEWTFTPTASGPRCQQHTGSYEIHVRRDGNEYVCTFALCHNFVGGVRIQAGNRSALVLSHDEPAQVSRPDSAVCVETGWNGPVRGRLLEIPSRRRSRPAPDPGLCTVCRNGS